MTNVRTANAGRADGDGDGTAGPVALPRATERVAVDFAGDGAGADEMSWGMWEIWHAMVGQRSALPLGGRAPLAAGTTVEGVVEELRYLMGRFPSMRTRLRFDAAGRPTQELFAAGRMDLEIYDAGAAADPDDVAAAVEQDYKRTAFDYAGQWPLRMAVVRQEGRPTHLVAVMNHLATDALGGLIMMREVKARKTAPATGQQQLEQARWQGSPAGQRQNERALRHWEDVLRALPARQLPGPLEPRSPRHWNADFYSPAMTAALPVIAARTGTELPAVRLGVFAVALHRVTGISPVAVRPVVNNRFRPALADVVCMAAQAGVCALDVDGASVEEVVKQARRKALAAYKHAYFHPERMRELVARVSRERGADVSVGCFFNDLTEQLPPPPGTRVRTAEELAEELAAALPALRDGSTFTWTARQDVPIERLFLSIEDTPAGQRFEFRVDTGYISPADTEALAHAMEAVAIETSLALSPTAARTGRAG
ncbi:condensation domain-containing protein [Streptomyces polygonati]|uniref:Condensation domain-containing protein n=1 Tax=Streptomyces polygonati TaxID=1617087 RepID=A0ABV8I0H2_9ACTN